MRGNQYAKGHKHTDEQRKKITLGQTGKKHWRYKGKYIKDGYVLIYMPSHPYCCQKRYVREHRLVVEKSLGRYLKTEESIHHINCVRDDNRLENLYGFENESEHQKYHMLYRKGKIKEITKSNLIKLPTANLRK